MKPTVTRMIATALALVVCIALTACGGGDDSDRSTGDDGGAPAAGAGDEQVDELGGAGHWTASQLCALSTAEAVSLQFGVAVEEKTTIDEAEQSACNWSLASDPLAQSPMRISNTAGFTSDGLGGDEPLDIAGADMAAYSANIGGGAHVDVVVGDQLLEIVFPVGAEGAREFGVTIATLWVGSQS